MESHGCRLLREPPWLANTQRATAPSGSDYCLIEFSLMSGRSSGPPLTVDSVIKHKNKTLAFHLGASRRGRQTPCMASFGDHPPVTPRPSISPLSRFITLRCPFLPLPLPPFRSSPNFRAYSLRRTESPQWKEHRFVTASQTAASCRGYAAHSLFSMSTTNKCL